MAERKRVGDVLFTTGDPRDHDGAAFTLDDLYQKTLSRVEEARRRPHLYGSDAGLCPRKNIFHHLIPQPSRITPANAGYMALGNCLEDLLAHGLTDHGRLYSQNMYLTPLESDLLPSVKVRGKMDLIIKDHQDKLGLVEVKTCGTLPTKPKMTHLRQVQLYSAVAGIDRVYLSYVSRKVSSGGAFGRLDVRTFDVPVDHDILLQRLYFVALATIGMIDKRVMPVHPTFSKSQECSWCPFTDFCWPVEANPLPLYEGSEWKEKKSFATDVARELLDRRLERYQETIDQLLDEATTHLNVDLELLTDEFDTLHS